MKLRLLEYLICPDHPDEYLQLRKGHVAKLFDYASEVRSPLCHSYCGLAQGRFEVIPGDFLPDCQFCMSLEIEWGILKCPVCGGFYSLFEGIPVLTNFFPSDADLAADRLAAEYHFGKSKLAEYRRNGPLAGWADRHEAKILAEQLDLEAVSSVLYLGGASTALIDMFTEQGIEMVIAGEDPHELIRLGEKELLNPSRLTFMAVSGPDPTGLRCDSFDLVISGYRLYGPAGFVPPELGDLRRICHKSGTVALVLYRDSLFKRVFNLCEGKCGRMNESSHMVDEFLSQLPSGTDDIEIERYQSSLLELIVLRTRLSPTEDIRIPFPGDEAEAMINA
jgi:uncharacterized protein YbaR (Trm112 family)